MLNLITSCRLNNNHNLTRIFQKYCVTYYFTLHKIPCYIATCINYNLQIPKVGFHSPPSLLAQNIYSQKETENQSRIQSQLYCQRKIQRSSSNDEINWNTCKYNRGTQTAVKSSLPRSTPRWFAHPLGARSKPDEKIPKTIFY